MLQGTTEPKQKSEELKKPEEAKKDFAILIPVTNSSSFVETMLASLKRFSSKKISILLVGKKVGNLYGAEMVDADPTDLEEVFKIGLRKIKEQWILFAESDLVFGPDWDVPFRKNLRKNLVLSALQFQNYGTLGWIQDQESCKTGTWSASYLPRKPSQLDWSWWLSVCNLIKKEQSRKWVRGWHREQFLVHRSLIERSLQFRNGDSLIRFIKEGRIDSRILLDSQILHLVE